LGWVAMLQQGAAEEDVLAGILASPEFLAHAGTLAPAPSTPSADFVGALYPLLLGRAGSSAEGHGWLRALPAGGYAGVARGFLASPEFRTGWVGALYFTNRHDSYSDPWPDPFFGLVPGLLKRSRVPPAGEVASWVNSGLDLLRVEVSIASSPEYFAN